MMNAAILSLLLLCTVIHRGESTHVRFGRQIQSGKCKLQNDKKALKWCGIVISTICVIRLAALVLVSQRPCLFTYNARSLTSTGNLQLNTKTMTYNKTLGM